MKIASKAIAPGQGHAVSRALLQMLYTRETGAPMPEILVTDRGKPYFANSPWHFSVSHTKKRVFVVLSDKNVGLDAEPVDREIDLRLAEKILSPAEKILFDGAQDQRSTLLKFWVLKEAYVKFTGKGLQGYPNHTAFTPDDPRVQIMDGHYVAVIDS